MSMLTGPIRLPSAGTARVRAELRLIWRTHRWRFTVLVLLFAGAALAGLVPPKAVGLLVDRLREGADASEVTLYGVVMLLGVLVQAGFTFAATWTSTLLGEDVFVRLRQEFMDAALALPMSTIETTGTGELVTRTTQDIDSISATVRGALPGSLIAGVTVIFTVVAAVLVSPVVAVVYLLAVPLLFVIMRWYLRRAPEVYRRVGGSYGPLFASMQETANGSRTVEALSLAEVRQRSMDAALAFHWHVTVERIRLRQRMLPWSNLAFAIPVFASLAWGGLLVVRGEATVGTVVTVTLYAAALVTPLESLIGWTDELQRGFVSFARILGVSEIRDAPKVSLAKPRSQEIELRNVRFAYRAGHEVLHDISLHVTPGERLAIVGPSGAGKSTIARLLAGIDQPTAGRVLVGGADISEIELARRRREVLLVTQESHIFAASVLENARLGHLDAPDAEVRAALGRIGALEWIDSLAEGWHTEVGSGGHALTGAQEQQLALARVVLADPHTLILDEATSAMDPRAARGLERALAAALGGRTVIAIAHRLYTAYDADRIAVVDDGRIVELGSHEELLAQGGSYAQLWNAWRSEGSA